MHKWCQLSILRCNIWIITSYSKVHVILINSIGKKIFVCGLENIVNKNFIKKFVNSVPFNNKGKKLREYDYVYNKYEGQVSEK